MKKKSILFFSYNRHQYKYFNFLSQQLSSDYNVFNLNINKSIINMLKTNLNPFKKIPTDQTIKFVDNELDDIINYSYKKTKIKNNIFNKVYYKIIKMHTLYLKKFFYKFITNNNIDMIIVWNGLHYPAATAVRTAKKMGIKTVYMENGYLPNTLVVDTEGVNYYNSLSKKKAEFYKSIGINKSKLKEIKSEGIKENNYQTNHNNFLELPDKYIFLPFQVHDDTQIIIHSPLVSNMKKLLEVVYNAVNKYNKEMSENYWLIAKEHPKDVGRINYDNLRKRYKKDKVKILKRGDTKTLIKNSQAVVTINSTVGIESLVYNKAVITLGKAFYNIAGLVYHAKKLEEIYNSLRGALKEGIDQDLIDNFLYFLRFHYLVEADKTNLNKIKNRQVIERIKNIMQGGKFYWE